ncbi:MAG: hypothetical protein ACXWUG_10875 [Polyangiales bacterium]
MLRDDFLMRMIRRLGDLIGRAMGLAKKGRHDEAEIAIVEIYKTEVGVPRDMLDRLDPKTVASTLGSEKSMIVAALLDAEAQLAKLAGNEQRAVERLARANAIRVAAGLPVTTG